MSKQTSDWMTATDTGAEFLITMPDGEVAQVSIDFQHPNVVRYRLAKVGAPPLWKFPLTQSTGWDPGHIDVETHQDYGLIRSAQLTVRVDKDPWQVSLFTPEGRLITRENPKDVNAKAQFVSAPTGFPAENRTRINFELFEDEHFYGFGEKFTDFDKRGQTLNLWNRNPYGSGTELAYKNIPFFLSTRGYGIFINTTVPSHCAMGSVSNASHSVEVEEGALDIYVVYGPAFKNILPLYQDLTGQPAVPPKWAFGLWLSPLGEERAGEDISQNAIVDLAEKAREAGIPADVIHLDPFWMGRRGYCRFEWGTDDYPNPAAMMQDLKERGFRVCLWEHPYIDVETEMFEEGDEKGYFLKKADGSTYLVNLVIAPGGTKQEYKEEFYDLGAIVDFSNPDAVEWYKEKHRPLLDIGTAVFKTDFGEEIPADSHWYNGKTGHEMHNAFPLLYNETVFDVTAEYSDQPMVWGRSAYAGSQKFPVGWSGDPTTKFPSLAATLRSGLSYALSGVPFWAHDLGGFKGQPSDDLYTRWTEFGIFTGLSRLHGTTTRMPWRYGEKVQSIVRKFVELRYKLLPYLYSTAIQCGETGIPFMQPMVLAYQDDPTTYGLDQQYLFGDNFLVAPVLNEEGSVTVYLPEGVWFDFWTGQRFEGPRWVKRDGIPLDELPVYVKGDSITPYAPLTQWVDQQEWNPLTLDVRVETSASYVLKDELGQTTITAVRTGRDVTVSIGDRTLASGSTPTYNVDLHGEGKSAQVTWNGSILDAAAYQQEGTRISVTCSGTGELKVSW